MFNFLQKIGKSLMLPIAVLPAAGLLLGIGGALSNVNTINTYPLLDIPILQGFFQVMLASGEVIFVNLALLICIGIAMGLAEGEKGTAALGAIVAFLVMNASIRGMISAFDTTNIKSIDTGVVGAIMIGSLVAYLHNKYRTIQLPTVLGFFGGSRFIPIVSSFCAIIVGAIFFIIWPPFQQILVKLGNIIASLGEFGTFWYGFSLRLSGAFGLHHMIYPLFWLTELGGVEVVAGETVVGAQNIFFAQLANPNHIGLFTEGTRFFAGRFATMMFGLPGACLAMYHATPSNRRKATSGIFLGAAITSFITGITEPIEFMFLFVAPALYVFHAFLDGLSFYIADLLNISIGNTFSGGVIDFTLFGILQGNKATNWILVPMVGVAWFLLYYFSFRFLIEKFDIKTPGRELEEELGTQIQSLEEITDEASAIITALGGNTNILEVDACITRLRVTLKDNTHVDKNVIKSLGAKGVLDVPGGIQVIFGAKADLLKQEINKILNRH